MKIWSCFFLCKRCPFLPHSFVTFLFFPLSVPASLPFLFGISFGQALKRSTVGEEHFPSFSRQQSSLVCSLAVSVVEPFLLILSLVPSPFMPRAMIWLISLLSFLPPPLYASQDVYHPFQELPVQDGSVASLLTFHRVYLSNLQSSLFSRTQVLV